MEKISVPLKIIWIGEHAVCYDKKAVGQTLNGLHLNLDFSGDYKKDNPDFVQKFVDEFLVKVSESLPNFKTIKLKSFAVDTVADFGIGLGTSAATAVALAQMVSLLSTGGGSHYLLSNLIAESEGSTHGGASGIDQFLVCQSPGVYTFQTGEGRAARKGFPYPFLILNSGGETGTAKMVELVRNLYQTKRNKIFNTMRQIGQLGYKFLEALGSNSYEEIYECLIKNQDLLLELGVVSENVQNFSQRLRAFKIAAKVTGAGGLGGGSGAIIVCYKSPEQYNVIRQMAEQFGFNLIYKAYDDGSGYG